MTVAISSEGLGDRYDEGSGVCKDSVAVARFLFLISEDIVV